MTGIDAVIQSLGVSAGPEIIFEPTRLFSKATQVLVTAMEEAGVKRLICRHSATVARPQALYRVSL